MKRRPALAMALSVVFAATGISAVTAVSAQAAGSATTASLDWEMNEGAGATVMHDSGPLGLNGSIGKEVQTGVSSGGATGYVFPRLTPNQPPAHPQHLVTVPNAAALNPGSGSFTVEIRYKTTNPFGNLIQKGQSTTNGGQFKIQLPKGKPQCYFKANLGRDGAEYNHAINDGQWHTLKCVRTATNVTLYVDGVKRGSTSGPIGNLTNTYPLTIGGKPNCDQVKVTCDYFGGSVDYVKITKG
jgi:hypothetical protein